MKHFVFFLLISTLVSCEEKVDRNKYEDVVLTDKFSNKLNKEHSDSITTAEYSPLYIGKFSNNINLSYLYYKTVKPCIFIFRDKYKFPKKDSIKIYIDTTKTIGTPMGMSEYSHTEKRNNKIAFPIFIENFSRDTLRIGYAEYLPLLIEAKDRKGNWRTIEKPLRFGCGTGIFDFYLAPNNIIISSLKIYNGNFKTKLRLVYKSSDEKIYSNQISGEINENQFGKRNVT